jgi:hypothetical protein
MNAPMMAAMTAINKTAAAAISFIFPISGFLSSVTWSANFYKAELNISADNTPPMHKSTKHHSNTLI